MSTMAVTLSDSSMRVRKALDGAGAPLSIPALVKGTRLGVDEVKRVLEDERKSGTVYAWPKFRGQQRYWHSEPEQFAREKIMEVAAECALSAGTLASEAKKRCHGYPEKPLKGLVGQLIREKELRKYGSFGREKELLAREGHPEAYGEAARRAIQAILEKARSAGAGLEPATAIPSEPGATFEPALLAAMAKIEPSQGAPISIRELRAALPQASKEDFDAAVLSLRLQHRVYLSRHDFPQSLTAEDRAGLIDGKDGSYYVAITARNE